MNILRIVLGAALAFAGRKLFWLFVAAIGFIVTANLATRFLSGQPEWVILLLALAAGVVGALLAVFVQRLAIGLAGFVAGGYLATTGLAIFGLSVSGGSEWIVYIVGGIIGAALLSALFDWALIVISALSGASVIVEALKLGGGTAMVVFVGIFVVGLVVQAGWMRREEKD